MFVISVGLENLGCIISMSLIWLRLNVTWRRRAAGGQWSRQGRMAHWTSMGHGRNTARGLAIRRENTGWGTQRCMPSQPPANTNSALSWRTGTSRSARLPTTTSKWPQRHKGEIICRGTSTHYFFLPSAYLIKLPKPNISSICLKENTGRQHCLEMFSQEVWT